ncbi:MAG: amidohydrolase [Actinomycetota bacterium]|nr:amidohydrolase [Actinomycetota bacterium]
MSAALVVDAHTHLWARWPYQPAVPDPHTRGSADSLVTEMDGAGVDHALVVAAGIPGAESNNDDVAAMVAARGGRLSLVADVDSSFGPTYHLPGAADRVREVLDRYAPAGVSHYLAHEDDGWLESGDGDAFLSVAEAAGVVLNLAARPAWAAPIRAAARRHPGLIVIVNHLALVMLHPEGLDEGLRLVLDDEPLPNLLVKVSGWQYGTERPWAYPYTARLSVARAFYETWGPDRLVWGSDWPSLLPHHTYRQAVQLLPEHAVFLDAADLEKVRGGTLARGLGLAERVSV